MSNSKKKILLISPNFYPEDTAIGLYNSQMMEYLSRHHETSVITGFPYYPQWRIYNNYRDLSRFIKEKFDNVTIYRYKQYVPKRPNFIKRIIHLISFTLGNLWNIFILKNKPDVVITVVPFTSCIFLGLVCKLLYKSKIWIHVQDFEFDAALQTGVGKNKNIIFSMLFKLEKWLFSKADFASTISYSMLNKLSEKTKSEQFFLPNWIDDEKINPATSKTHRYLKSEKIKILYSGNIGDKQDWKAFIQFCKDIKKSKYEIIIVGDGAKKEWVCNAIKVFSNIRYYPPVPFEELSDLLCSTDVHILFQKPEVIDTVMPSKVLGMMASAKPSIIIGNDKSEIKSIFEASGAGLFYSKYSNTIVNGLEYLTTDKNVSQKKGQKARDYVIENFSKSKILSNMLKKLKEL